MMSSDEAAWIPLEGPGRCSPERSDGVRGRARPSSEIRKVLGLHPRPLFLGY